MKHSLYSKHQTTLGEYDAVRKVEVNHSLTINHSPGRVNPNSVVSYHDLGDKKKVQCEMVLEAIKTLDHPNIRDIRYFLNMEVSSVCGRLGDLKRTGLIKVGGQKHDERTNKTTDWYEEVRKDV